MKSARLAFASIILGSAAFAGAQNFSLGIAYQVYFPTSGVMKSVFGSTWQGFGISPGSTALRNGFKLDTDFTFISRESGPNRVSMFIPSVGITQSFPANGMVQSAIKPYVAARIGLNFIDYSFTFNATPFDATRTLFATNVEAGVVVSNRMRLALRYDWINKTQGLDFSGWSFRAEYTVLSF